MHWVFLPRLWNYTVREKKYHKTFSRYGHIRPIQGPKLLPSGHEIYNLGRGCHGQHKHAKWFENLD